MAHGIQLQLDAEIADGLRRFNEGAPDVVIPYQCLAVRDAGFGGVTNGRGDPGIRHGNDKVGVGGRFDRQQAPQPLA